MILSIICSISLALWSAENRLGPFLQTMVYPHLAQIQDVPKQFQALWAMHMVQRGIHHVNLTQPPVPRAANCRDGAISLCEVLLKLGWYKEELKVSILSPKPELYILGYYSTHIIVCWRSQTILDTTGDIALWPVDMSTILKNWTILEEKRLDDE